MGLGDFKRWAFSQGKGASAMTEDFTSEEVSEQAEEDAAMLEAAWRIKQSKERYKEALAILEARHEAYTGILAVGQIELRDLANEPDGNNGRL